MYIISGEWFGIVRGQICQYLTNLSVPTHPYFLFPDNNLSKFQSVNALILWGFGLQLQIL